MDDLTRSLVESGNNGVVAERADSRHLPGHAYASQDLYDREMAQIFRRAWIFVARAEELPKAGDYMTQRISGEPIIIVRESEESIAVLANVCRHRGVEVASGTGNAREFMCPYHGWLYGIDGKLNAAPYMKKSSVDLKDCRLPRMAVKNWRGFIFMSFADEPEPFETFIAAFEDALGFLQPENCRVAIKKSFDVNCNWKLAVENLMDIYHAGVVHAASFGRYYKGDKEDYNFHLHDNGGYNFFLEAAPYTPDTKSAFGKFPWLAEYKDTLAYTAFLPPNMPFVGRSDSFRVWTVWPQAVDKTRLTSHTLFAADALETPDLATKLKPYEDILDRVVEEDRTMIESLQRGISSVNFEPGPFSHLESAIHNCIRNYLRTMGAAAG